LTPAASPDLKATAAEAAKKKVAPLVKSSIPAGQPLKGLNFLKDRQDPVAKADDEYPAWLWTILDRQEKKAEKGAGDLFCEFLAISYILHVLPCGKDMDAGKGRRMIC
jgi:large subunit ribosomal protein L54